MAATLRGGSPCGQMKLCVEKRAFFPTDFRAQTALKIAGLRVAIFEQKTAVFKRCWSTS
jgi:hypothetical protein